MKEHKIKIENLAEAPLSEEEELTEEELRGIAGGFDKKFVEILATKYTPYNAPKGFVLPRHAHIHFG